MNPENHVRETIGSLDGLIQGFRGQMELEPPKPSIIDYLRLVQLRLELGKEYGTSCTIKRCITQDVKICSSW